MKERLAIIVTAYNRSNALNNLLVSLDKIRCSIFVDLIISIDNGGSIDVNKLANDYIWRFGNKKVIVHNHKKGLVNHFIWVGDQTKDYENIIFLEDDLFVSPELISFSLEIIDFYKNEDQVAGISLYSPMICEFDSCRFYPNQDGKDVYFLQHPYWGNIWSYNKWEKFKDWLVYYNCDKLIIPEGISSQSESFKKIYIQYLVETNRFIVIPRISLVTNNGEKGLHSNTPQYQFQSVLLNNQFHPRFCKIEESFSIYDSYMEILPSILKHYNSNLISYDFEVDLRGLKMNIQKKFVLTTRKSKNVILEYNDKMKPRENGVIYNASGNGIILSHRNDIVYSSKYEKSRLYNDIINNNIISMRVGLSIVKNSILTKIAKKFK